MNGQSCPICSVTVEPSTRYPTYVCSTCASDAVDVSGRKLEFFNESFSGGYVARYADTLEPYDSHECFVRGVRCHADEAHMGGIVIRAV